MGGSLAQGGVPPLHPASLPVPRARCSFSCCTRRPCAGAFRGRVDGDASGRSRGVDVDEDGNGVLRDRCRYQLVREQDAMRERAVEVTFLKLGAAAYAFTFG